MKAYSERIVPEVVSRHKDPYARKNLVQKYFKRHKKSIFIAYAWWFLLSFVGAHRLYLRQYIAAGIVFLLFLLIALIISLTPSTNFDSYLTEPHPASFLFLVLHLGEGLLLIFGVGSTNDRILIRLKEDIESVPYVPLS